VSPVRYELGSFIPEVGILHSHRREHFNSCTTLTELGLFSTSVSRCPATVGKAVPRPVQVSSGPGITGSGAPWTHSARMSPAIREPVYALDTNLL
jgi:hypothetical protein